MTKRANLINHICPSSAYSIPRLLQCPVCLFRGTTEGASGTGQPESLQGRACRLSFREGKGSYLFFHLLWS